MVVVKWSACSPSTKTIQVWTPLKPTFFCKNCLEKTKINKKRPGLALFKKHLPSEYANSSTLGLVWPDRAIFEGLGGKFSYQSKPNICEHFGCSEKHILWNNCTYWQLFGQFWEKTGLLFIYIWSHWLWPNLLGHTASGPTWFFFKKCVLARRQFSKKNLFITSTDFHDPHPWPYKIIVASHLVKRCLI